MHTYGNASLYLYCILYTVQWYQIENTKLRGTLVSRELSVAQESVRDAAQIPGIAQVVAGTGARGFGGGCRLHALLGAGQSDGPLASREHHRRARRERHARVSGGAAVEEAVGRELLDRRTSDVKLVVKRINDCHLEYYGSRYSTVRIPYK